MTTPWPTHGVTPWDDDTTLKGYIDDRLVGSEIGFTPSGSITATNVQDAIMQAAADAGLFTTPEDYGAVGDGVTDDHDALTDWVTAICAGTAAGFTTGKFYFTSAKIEVPGSELTIFGSGQNKSAIIGAPGITIMGLADPTTRAYNWIIRDIQFDGGDATPAGSGGVGLDLTNVTNADIDVAVNQVETGVLIGEEAYYNVVHARINTVETGVLIADGVTSCNETEWHIKVSDCVTGVKMDNATNQTFIKPSIEVCSGDGFDIAETTATQYTNIIAPRFENIGGTCVNNRALAQSTLWVGGMASAITGPDWINAAAQQELKVVRNAAVDPEAVINRVMFADLDESQNAMVYWDGGNVTLRNQADSGYRGLDLGDLIVRGDVTVPTGDVDVTAGGVNALAGDATVLRVMLVEAGSPEALIYWDGGNVTLRNQADSGYRGLDFGAATVRGTLFHVSGNLGFYGASPISKPTVTGSRGGNAALASLLTALANLGLIVDSSS